MICKSCGTEIAGKALVCYRCGVATDEPPGRPTRRRRGPVGRAAAVVGLVGLSLAALYLGRAPLGDPSQISGWVTVGLVVGLLAWWFVRRR